MSTASNQPRPLEARFFDCVETDFDARASNNDSSRSSGQYVLAFLRVRFHQQAHNDPTLKMQRPQPAFQHDVKAFTCQVNISWTGAQPRIRLVFRAIQPSIEAPTHRLTQ